MPEFLLVFFSLLLFAHGHSQELNTLTEVSGFGKNPGNLRFFIHNHVPQDSAKLPLVVVLHGCSQRAKDVAELTGWNKLADRNDFVVLYPQQKRINNPNLCFNWFNHSDIEKNKGEGESIFQMISFAVQNYAIDSTRIYITGLSAGAAMSVVLLATHPESFRQGAVFAGGAYKIAVNPVDGISAMLGKKYVSQEKLTEYVREQNPQYEGDYPVLTIYQGMNDPVVNQKSAEFLVSQWTGIHGSDTLADKIELAYLGVEDITRMEYTNSAGKTIVIRYEVNHLGHKLMVKPGEKECEGGKTGLFGVDKGFHSTYQTAKEFGIVKQKCSTE